MNPNEALKLCRLAKAASPAQSVDEYTPELWALVLKPHRYADAEEALTQLAGEQEWIHVSHIKKRIKKIRHERVVAYGVLPDPPSSIDPDDTGVLQQWQIDFTRRIADGDEVTDNPRALPASPWSDGTSPVEAEAERQATRARVAELKAGIARRTPEPDRPDFATLAAPAAEKDRAKVAAVTTTEEQA